MRTAISAFTVYTATTMDLHPLGFAHEIFISKAWDPDEVWQNVLAGEPSMLGVASPTLSDPDLAPPGEQLVVCLALLPYDIGTPWAAITKSGTRSYWWTRSKP